MKKLLSLSVVLFAAMSFTANAQFVLNGNASVTSPECSDSTTTYQLTPDALTQAGEIWYTTQVSLTNRFDIQFQMFLGTKAFSVGADGICFVFQQQSVNAGSTGGGMGYGGITPSLAVEFDTYHNAWDPNYCHTAIEQNGDVNHTDLSGNNLAGPVQLDPVNPNLPDGNWHNMEIIWDPTTQTLSVYYDCQFRVSYTGNIVANIFGGNPNVYWGFTAGTGGSDNQQEVCIANSYLNNLRDTSVCAGNSVTMTAQGGVTYSWSPGAGLNTTTGPTVIATPTATTTYTVSITNACGLITKDSTTISVNGYPTATITSSKNILCGGTNTGSATVTASGGTAPYTYAWAPSGGSNATATGLSAGTYTVTVSDGIGCTTTAGVATVTITEPPQLRDSVEAGINTFCGGVDSVAIGVKGGTGVYTYSWAPGGYTTSKVTGLSAGTYTINVTDGNGCTKQLIVPVSANGPLSITIASRTTLLCEQFGYIAAHAASGGQPPYTYLWTPRGGNSIFTTTDLTAGTYTITATDSNGCTATASETIAYPPKLTATSNLINGTICFGEGNTGSASVTPTGGTPPYTYDWYPGNGTNASQSGLSAATYTVTVTDSIGCTTTTAVTITEPTGMSIKIDSIDNTNFFGCNGLASVTVLSGGTPPYTYMWSPGGQTTDTIKNQCAGYYCCTVTQSNGCYQTVCVDIINSTSGIENIGSGSDGITVYPNPSNGEFTIRSSEFNGQWSVGIYDVLGQRIYSQQATGNSNVSINLRDKSAGIYFYRILKDDGSLLGSGKVIIQK